MTERPRAEADPHLELPPPRVLLADDHPIFRHGAREIILRRYPQAQVTEAENAAQALELIWKRAFDLVILDISMPGRSGLDVLRDIKRDKPKLPVLIVSMHGEEDYAVRMVKAGAAGYLTKDRAGEELLNAVTTILAGGTFISPTLGQHLARHLSRPGDLLPHERLSDREYEVFLALVSGRSPTEVAENICLSVKTVSTYRTRILEKMAASSNADLIRYAREHGLT